ncbi:hypothetical protein BKK54_03215 [Rodentibacter genomosp. 1]|uniref:Uncharacterized protein n=1 Tax=Rodentibacter genomosp. 1 TaxID=1908264 RepID=A0A1V3J8B4_9PAST|nr:hypothetical protein [Rodentibacter genomosp. 1]OOF51434.1 hypothetical protein BKK54_03215 [Rodentibacter genomosp. 1]
MIKLPKLAINECFKKIMQLQTVRKQNLPVSEVEVSLLRQKCEKLLKTKHRDYAYAIMGCTHSLLGETEIMISYFEKALEISPNDPQINYNYAIELLNNFQVPQAISQFRKAAELNSDLVFLFPILDSFLQLICIDEAQSVLDKIKSQVYCNKELGKNVEINASITGNQNLINGYTQLPKGDLVHIQTLIHQLHCLKMKNYPKNIAIEHTFDGKEKEFVYAIHDKVSPLEKIWQFDDELMQDFINFEEKHDIHLPYFTLMYQGA